MFGTTTRCIELGGSVLSLSESVMIKACREDGILEVVPARPVIDIDGETCSWPLTSLGSSFVARLKE